MIELTESAKNQIEKLCKENNLYAVTLGMKGGGCAGFEYDWNAAKTKEELDENSTIIEAGEGLFAVEPMSLLYLMGSTIDYKTSIIGSQLTSGLEGSSTCPGLLNWVEQSKLSNWASKRSVTHAASEALTG